MTGCYSTDVLIVLLPHYLALKHQGSVFFFLVTQNRLRNWSLMGHGCVAIVTLINSWLVLKLFEIKVLFLNDRKAKMRFFFSCMDTNNPKVILNCFLSWFESQLSRRGCCCSQVCWLFLLKLTCRWEGRNEQCVWTWISRITGLSWHSVSDANYSLCVGITRRISLEECEKVDGWPKRNNNLKLFKNPMILYYPNLNFLREV